MNYTMLVIDRAQLPTQHPKPAPRDPIPSIEIFSGAGGLALGLELAGFQHLALVERDRYAVETLRQNGLRRAVSGHSWPVIEADVRTIDYWEYEGRVRLLAGGAPCQPFSLGGRQRGHEDDRNLFPEVFRAVRALQPEVVLLENVRNLAGKSFRPYFDYLCLQLALPFEKARSEATWQEHRDHLSSMQSVTCSYLYTDREQYHVKAFVLNAADYGIPQIRHRVFIVGVRKDLGFHPTIPRSRFDEDALAWSQWIDKSYWKEHNIASKSIPDMPEQLVPRVRRLLRHGKPFTERWRTLRDALAQRPALPEPTFSDSCEYQRHILVPGARVYRGHSGNVLDRPAKAIKAGDHGNPGGEHVLVRPGHEPRYLTIRECARIQTFPDSYHFLGSRSEAMRQLGNAVPVRLAHEIGKEIRTLLEQTTGVGTVGGLTRNTEANRTL